MENSAVFMSIVLRRVRPTLMTAVFLLGMCSMADASTVIDTTAGWGDQVVGYWGEPPYTATHGQTFTVGADTRLDSFTFYVMHDAAGDALDFAAYVMNWDDAAKHATGTVLYESAVIRSTTALSPVTVDTGGISLEAGQKYVAFLSTTNIHGGGGRGWAGYAYNVYDGGEFVYIANGGDFAALTSRAWVWDYPERGGDLAFRMAFNVPAAATVPLPAAAGAGITLLTCLAMRRPSRGGLY